MSSTDADNRSARAAGAVPRRLFTFWTGDNPMSDDRKRCAATLHNAGCSVHLVTPETLSNWIVPDAPLHPAFDLLSAVHKSDYLRAYFMHHHGGGYSDVKETRESWLPAFERLDANLNAFAIGYPEQRGKWISHFHRHPLHGQSYYLDQPTSARANGLRHRWLRHCRRYLIGNGAYIFRHHTAFTAEWMRQIHFRLDLVSDALRLHPARDPRDAPGHPLPGEGPSRYPLPWSAICADVLHPLEYRHRGRFLHGVPTPNLKNYR